MGLTDSDVERARPLMRLFLAQALRRLTQELAVESGRPVSRYRHELLLMLDEFPLLGRLGFFEKALAVMPGCGIRACLITQGLAQHRAVYAVGGRHESIVTTCDVRVALAANDFESLSADPRGPSHLCTVIVATGVPNVVRRSATPANRASHGRRLPA